MTNRLQQILKRGYRVGIIGAGRIGRVHAESLTRAGAELVSVSCNECFAVP